MIWPASPPLTATAIPATAAPAPRISSAATAPVRVASRSTPGSRPASRATPRASTNAPSPPGHQAEPGEREARAGDGDLHAPVPGDDRGDGAEQRRTRRRCTHRRAPRATASRPLRRGGPGRRRRGRCGPRRGRPPGGDGGQAERGEGQRTDPGVQRDPVREQPAGRADAQDLPEGAPELSMACSSQTTTRVGTSVTSAAHSVVTVAARTSGARRAGRRPGGRPRVERRWIGRRTVSAVGQPRLGPVVWFLWGGRHRSYSVKDRAAGHSPRPPESQ